jgi:hypothetical protein
LHGIPLAKPAAKIVLLRIEPKKPYFCSPIFQSFHYEKASVGRMLFMLDKPLGTKPDAFGAAR